MSRPPSLPGLVIRHAADQPLPAADFCGSGERLIDRMPPLRFFDEWYPVVGGVYFIANDGLKQAIEFYDLRTQEIHQIYVLEKPPQPWGSGLSVSPDRTWLLYSQVDESMSDLMLVENFH